MTQLLPGSALSVSELDAAMAAMDADGDGAVSFAELQGWLHAQGESLTVLRCFLSRAPWPFVVYVSASDATTCMSARIRGWAITFCRMWQRRGWWKRRPGEASTIRSPMIEI